MAACVRRGAHVVMAGTICYDGPLPGVIHRFAGKLKLPCVRQSPVTALRLSPIASTLHAVATGNQLPADHPIRLRRCQPSCPDKTCRPR